MAILAFSGSIRTHSVNTALLRETVRAAQAQDLFCEHLSLKDYPLPLYNQDLEEKDGFPEYFFPLREKAARARGFIIATPEYNGSLTPLLKNTIDWLSRPFERENYGALFTQKPLLLVSASPGPGGGKNSISHARDIFSIFQTDLSPQPLIFPRAYGYFENNTLHLSDSLKQELTAAVLSLAAAVK
ncbi:MAG: NADPH-dependent FMN reductase [Fibrobacterota bacterium]